MPASHARSTIFRGFQSFVYFIAITFFNAFHHHTRSGTVFAASFAVVVSAVHILYCIFLAVFNAPS